MKENYIRNYKLLINHTLAFYYRDCTKILSSVIRKAQIIEHEKLIQNIQNNAKTTPRGVINKESGRNKKRSEIQDLNMEGKKKITDQQTVAENCNDYFVATAENVKRQRKINFINDNNNSVDNHIHFIEQAFRKP